MLPVLVVLAPLWPSPTARSAWIPVVRVSLTSLSVLATRPTVPTLLAPPAPVAQPEPALLSLRLARLSSAVLSPTGATSLPPRSAPTLMAPPTSMLPVLVVLAPLWPSPTARSAWIPVVRVSLTSLSVLATRPTVPTLLAPPAPVAQPEPALLSLRLARLSSAVLRPTGATSLPPRSAPTLLVPAPSLLPVLVASQPRLLPPAESSA